MTSWYTADGEAVEGLPDVAEPASMSRRARYVMNNHSFGEFMRSTQVRKPVVEVAHGIARHAADHSPRRKHGVAPPGTALADRFEVKAEAGELVVNREARVKVEVFNSAASAAPNEFGNKRTKRHRMLGRAGAAYGDFKPTGGLN
jgi:hypothetical protein